MSQDHDPTEHAHSETVRVLAKLVDVLSCDDLSLLCWNCGISTDELMPIDDELELPPHKRSGYAEKVYMQADDLRKWRKENGTF